MAPQRPDAKKPSPAGGLVYSTETGDMRKSGLKGLEGIKLTDDPPTAKSDSAKQGKITIKLDSKKHRGKTVTLVDGVKSENLQSLLKTLKTLCGVGGHLDESTIVLQGDQRQRVEEIISNSRL